MAEIDLSEAKSQLSALIDRLECGETLTMTRDGKPVARIVPMAQRRPGLLEDQIGMAPDFDATPEWLVEALEGSASYEVFQDPLDFQSNDRAGHASSVGDH